MRKIPAVEMERTRDHLELLADALQPQRWEYRAVLISGPDLSGLTFPTYGQAASQLARWPRAARSHVERRRLPPPWERAEPPT